jgi:hypothetical protein
MSIFRGSRIIESLAMVDGPFFDWSACRSPGRARRRFKRGFRQHVRQYYKPRRDALSLDGGRTLIMHPETAAAARAAIQSFAEKWRTAEQGFHVDPPANPLSMAFAAVRGAIC